MFSDQIICVYYTALVDIAYFNYVAMYIYALVIPINTNKRHCIYKFSLSNQLILTDEVITKINYCSNDH